MIKVSDYIAKTLAQAQLRQVFMLTGGGAMHLNDALAKHPDLNVIFTHHEQAAAMAAESYARLTNRMAIVNVTTGPGGLNALNGVFGAWTDSIPMLVISGQVRLNTTVASSHLPLRQLGDQEYDIVKSVAPMSKYAVMVTDPTTIRYHLQKAIFLATTGRKGPVWLDIPIDVQAAQVDETTLPAYTYPAEDCHTPPPVDNTRLEEIISKINAAQRPVILVGTGVRLSGAHEAFLALIQRLGIPVVTAFNAHDVVANQHPYYCGRAGTVGDRAGNFVVQNADMLLILGCRLNIRQISYNGQLFSRESFKIAVDIDAVELQKPTLTIDMPVHADLADFMPRMLDFLAGERFAERGEWLRWCHERQQKYPVVLAEYWSRTDSINPYCFIDVLSGQLAEDDIVVTGNATACITAFQALTIQTQQRLYSNSGSASMGYDLPAAIGACVGADRQRVICLAGDGSLQQNIQELATIRYHNFPIKLFVLNNQGYHSIRQTQKNYFPPPYVGVSQESGLFFPDLQKLAQAYDLPYLACKTHDQLAQAIEQTLAGDFPVLCEVFLTLEQAFAPKLSSKMGKDGRMISSPLEDLAPFLSREELKSNMIIDLIVEE